MFIPNHKSITPMVCAVIHLDAELYWAFFNLKCFFCVWVLIKYLIMGPLKSFFAGLNLEEENNNTLVFLQKIWNFFFPRLVRSKLEEEEIEDDVDNDINNRRMLSRLGVWLLVGVCSEPARCESVERLGRLVSMVLSWIETASTLRRDYVGELLKRLTSQYVCRWLTQVRDNKFDLLCACLSPDPPGYVKVGGCWDTMSSKERQHMEGLHRLCCVIPHNIVTREVRSKQRLLLPVVLYQP